MSKKDEITDPAEHLFAEGKKFDWKQDESPAAATLARANFQQAGAMGHKGAVRALAHMVYEGRGGERDQSKGLLLLWSAYRRGDANALEELTDLLATYGEEASSAEHRRTAMQLAVTLEDVNLTLSKAEHFMYRLAMEQASSPGQADAERG